MVSPAQGHSYSREQDSKGLQFVLKTLPWHKVLVFTLVVFVIATAIDFATPQSLLGYDVGITLLATILSSAYFALRRRARS